MTANTKDNPTREMYLVMRTDRKVKRWLKERRTEHGDMCGTWVRYPAWATAYMDHSSAVRAWVDHMPEPLPKSVLFVRFYCDEEDLTPCQG